MQVNSKSNIARLRVSQGFDRKFLMWRRTVKYGMSNFRRNIWLSLAAILVMSFTLFTVFVAAAATVMLNDTVENTKIDKLDLPLYLRSDTPPETQETIKELFEEQPNVAYVNITTKEDNLAKLEENVEIDDATRQLLEESGSKLEDILPVYMAIHVYDISNIDDLVEIVNGENSEYKGLLDVNSHEKQFFNGESQQTVQNMTNIANTIQMIGFVLGGVFLTITILVIFNTIRLAIFARKDEIEMEKAIGAERSYVRGPFIIEAQVYGVISGLIALIFGYITIISFMPGVLEGEPVGGISTVLLGNIMTTWAPAVIFGMLFLGIAIGSLSARLAVRKYLRY